MTKKSFLSLLVVGLAIVSLITFVQVKPETFSSGVVAKNFGGAFTLSDHNGKTVTEKDFRYQYRLIYFGFTYCPAICPTELQRINTVLKNLGERGKKIQPIFISVDPERDTIKVMKNYVSLFHPRLIGLTGTVEQIESVKKSYKIYAKKVQDDTMSDYTVDHSTFIYFMGPQDTLLKIFKTDDSVEHITETIEKFMGFDPNLQ